VGEAKRRAKEREKAGVTIEQEEQMLESLKNATAERAAEQRMAFERRKRAIAAGIIVPDKAGSFITHLEAHDMAVKIVNRAITKYDAHLRKTFILTPRPRTLLASAWEKLCNGYDWIARIAERREPRDDGARGRVENHDVPKGVSDAGGVAGTGGSRVEEHHLPLQAGHRVVDGHLRRLPQPSEGEPGPSAGAAGRDHRGGRLETREADHLTGTIEEWEQIPPLLCDRPCISPEYCHEHGCWRLEKRTP
jgi:hypothetical protein